ncbi:ABC transporter substrate-binding protein [Paenibacillus thalictri]|uniref:Myristoyl transferase n=1 Tax=Paenibacillus thalictri TaxID=2527873 RepID=A0A4Q9DPV2_9BACL|nr:ABC transporter substrate-binding protein [Paenibacillus thalictri]TBL77256.1 myristoyl transferase [Paenibacillus thalictri]
MLFNITNGKKVRPTAVILLVIAVSLMVFGCGVKETKNEPTAAAPAKTEAQAQPAKAAAPKEQVPIKLITAWFAKGNDGGLFAALQQNYYKDSGIDMTIQPGGPGISALQIVTSGKADFGITYADDVLKAREQGLPVVGLMTTFQKEPRVFLFHKENNITKFEDMNGKKVFVGAGAMYWEFIKNKYKLNVDQINYSGSLSGFIADKGSLNQGYVSNEPFVLKKQGVDVSFLKVADSGYANYCNILFTTEKYIKEHPEIVDAVVKASQKGWEYYNENFQTVNPLINQYNPDLPVENLNNEASVQKDSVMTGDAVTYGMGYMSKERWETLQSQLLELNIIKQKQDVTQMFTTKFLNLKNPPK